MSVDDRDAAIVAHLIGAMPPQHRAFVAHSTALGHGRLHDRLRLALRGVARSRTDACAVHIHAAACELPSGLGLLLPGRTGAGKSTLAAALAHHRGAGIVADDSVRVQRGRAIGNGTPIALRAGSPMWSVAQGLWYADPGGRMIVRPDDLGGSIVFDINVDLIAVPRFGEPFAVEPLSAAASFAWMCSMLLGPASDDDLAGLSREAAAVPSCAIHYDSLEDALRAADALVGVAQERRERRTVQMLGPDEVQGMHGRVWGARFDDEVVLVNRSTSQVVHLVHWPAGTSVELPSWSRLVGSRRVDR